MLAYLIPMAQIALGGSWALRRRLLVAPLRLLQYDAISIRIFERPTTRFPIRIVRIDLPESRGEHDAIEGVVILEAPEDAQTEPTAVHVRGPCEIADRPRDAQMRLHAGASPMLRVI